MKYIMGLREIIGIVGYLMFVFNDKVSEAIWNLPVKARIAIMLLGLYYISGIIEVLFPAKKKSNTVQ